MCGYKVSAEPWINRMGTFAFRTSYLALHSSIPYPASMCHEIYDNCASPKRKLIIEGAAHAESYYKDMEAYEKALSEFADEVMQGKSLDM